MAVPGGDEDLLARHPVDDRQRIRRARPVARPFRDRFAGNAREQLARLGVEPADEVIVRIAVECGQFLDAGHADARLHRRHHHVALGPQRGTPDHGLRLRVHQVIAACGNHRNLQPERPQQRIAPRACRHDDTARMHRTMIGIDLVAAVAARDRRYARGQRHGAARAQVVEQAPAEIARVAHRQRFALEHRALEARADPRLQFAQLRGIEHVEGDAVPAHQVALPLALLERLLLAVDMQVAGMRDQVLRLDALAQGEPRVTRRAVDRAQRVDDRQHVLRTSLHQELQQPACIRRADAPVQLQRRQRVGEHAQRLHHDARRRLRHHVADGNRTRVAERRLARRTLGVDQHAGQAAVEQVVRRRQTDDAAADHRDIGGPRREGGGGGSHWIGTSYAVWGEGSGRKVKCHHSIG